MANALYDRGRDNFAKGKINWIADDIRILLIDVADYAANITVDEFLTDIPPVARVAEAQLLTRTTLGEGTVSAANPLFTAVTGDQSEALVVYKRVESTVTPGTTNEGASLLIEYIDNAPGLPVLPNGGDIRVAISNSGLFKL